MFCGGEAVKADALSGVALLTEASTFLQWMGLFLQGAVFIWVDLLPAFSGLKLTLPIALSLCWGLSEEVKAWICASPYLCRDEI